MALFSRDVFALTCYREITSALQAEGNITM